MVTKAPAVKAHDKNSGHRKVGRRRPPVTGRVELVAHIVRDGVEAVSQTQSGRPVHGSPELMKSVARGNMAEPLGSDERYGNPPGSRGADMDRISTIQVNETTEARLWE